MVAQRASGSGHEPGGSARRTAIVTGAASGIGRAVCLQLAREGIDVAAVDVNAAGVGETVQAVESLGRAALAAVVDVSHRAQVRAMVERVLAAWGQIDILINCAGIFPHTHILDLDEEEWDQVIDCHLKGTFLSCQAVLPSMIERRTGRIVNTVSGLANAGQAATAAYAAAKGGIISFTRVLATEVEPYGITANAYGPGITDTPMVRGAYTSEQIAVLSRRSPFGRLATPEESAEIAVWFTRPETSHITGRIFV